MGYDTKFKGILEFTEPLTDTQYEDLKDFMGIDCRTMPEWNKYGDLTWIDLIIDTSGNGIVWDGSEKSYDMVEKVNLLVQEMQKKYPNFGLRGEMIAQGDDINDRWKLVMENGMAFKRTAYILNNEVSCPYCGKAFMIWKEN